MSLKFKSPTDAVIHVASTNGNACRVGPKWREIPPSLVPEAIAAGCISNNMTAADIDAAANKRAGEEAFQQRTVIRNAIIAMLEDEEHRKTNFTKAGTPAMDALSAKCGFGVDRAMALEVWHEMEDAAAANEAETGTA
jgi:hypothetical protein